MVYVQLIQHGAIAQVVSTLIIIIIEYEVVVLMAVCDLYGIGSCWTARSTWNCWWFWLEGTVGGEEIDVFGIRESICYEG